MFTELREFELAKKYMMTANRDTKGIMAMQADWAMNINDPQAAWYCACCDEIDSYMFDPYSITLIMKGEGRGGGEGWGGGWGGGGGGGEGPVSVPPTHSLNGFTHSPLPLLA